MDKSRIIFRILITLLLATVSLCVRNKSELEWKDRARLPAVSLGLVQFEITPKALANSSPELERQRQLWDR